VLVRTDDEVYRVDAVWLGPPRATFPWRARYVSYGVGLLTMMSIMFVQRRLGIPLDFFSVAWALVGTVAVTRLLGKKISYERPFGQVVTHFWSEVSGPRRRTAAGGGTVRTEHVKIRSTRSRPPAQRRGKPDRRKPAANTPAPVAPTPQPVTPEGRAAPVRTTPDSSAWESRRSRPATAKATTPKTTPKSTPKSTTAKTTTAKTATASATTAARRTGRTTKEARRGRA
jgi:hypothetical protein